jgi:polar amino acid transport system substrate-binding protein
VIARTALVLMMAAGPIHAETWRIGTEADYAPFIFRDETGALVGFDKDLGDAICAAAAVTCIWTETSFDNLLAGLAAGKFDLVLAGIGATESRTSLVDFSRAYRDIGSNQGVFVGLTEGVPVDGARIGVQAGTTHEDWLTETGRFILGYGTTDLALEALLSRQVDLVFGSASYMQHAFETTYPQIRFIAREEFPSEGPSVAVGKGDTALLEQINAIIAALWDEGTLDALDERWFVTGEPV